MTELPTRPDRLPPPLEMRAMKVLWSHGPATVGQVRDELEPTKPLAYTTVLTLLDRLARKGAVTRRKKGRGYIYSPALRRETAIDLAIHRLLDDFFDNDREELVAFLEGNWRAATSEATKEDDQATLESALL